MDAIFSGTYSSLHDLLNNDLEERGWNNKDLFIFAQ
jgi:hypothetical protein